MLFLLNYAKHMRCEKMFNNAHSIASHNSGHPNTFSPKATDLHKELQNLGSIMKQTKHALSNHGSLSPNIYIQIQHINSKHNFNIPQPPLNSQDLPQWLQQTKIAWRTLYNARNLENSQHL